MSLEGQVVLVTGGSRGIGHAIALRVAQERPAQIVIGYCSNHRAARATLKELEAQGVPACAISTDVGDPALLRDLFAQVEQRFGRLDVFVSNAARTSFRPAMELDPRTWQQIMGLNAGAFLLGSQLAAELMRRNGGGRIIGLSSLGSRFCAPAYAGLGAAKAAMESLMRYLALELAPWDINVNMVSGGFVDTDSMRLAPNFSQLAAGIVAHTPAGRVARPEDLAGVVAFLCSRDSDWVRGQVLVADGGYSLSL
jgi:enoyl-[acyl-carrier protein] reductase III